METNLTQNTKKTENYQFDFQGKGSEYFAIMIVNTLLTILTLGLYYPWAKAKKLRYIYGQTSLNKERFHFAGTGGEMFRGFVMVYLSFFVLIGVFLFITLQLESPFIAYLFFYAVIFAVIPFAIHGSLKYGMSRTSYRSIRFGYRGDRNELIKKYYKWGFLTIITCGIYGAWLAMNVRRYTHQHIRYGDVEFSNDAKGEEFFLIILKGYLLTIITLGIYSFWFFKDMFNYYIDNMQMTKGDQKIKCHSTARVGDFFSLIVVNLLIIVFTFGIGAAWTEMRTQRFIFSHIKMTGDIVLEDIQQTETSYKDATAEGALDFLDIEI